jgi:hypothetical protein
VRKAVREERAAVRTLRSVTVSWCDDLDGVGDGSGRVGDVPLEPRLRIKGRFASCDPILFGGMAPAAQLYPLEFVLELGLVRRLEGRNWV